MSRCAGISLQQSLPAACAAGWSRPAGIVRHPACWSPHPPPAPSRPACSTEFDGYSADETVRVVMSGNQEPRSVEITQEAYEQVGTVRGAVLV